MVGVEGFARCLWRYGVGLQPTLGPPVAPLFHRPLGITLQAVRELPVLPTALRPFPTAMRRLANAFPASACKCQRKNTHGWCLLQILDRDFDGLLEIKKRASLFSSWIKTGGPEPGSLGGADAAARDVLKRSHFRRRKRRAAVVLMPRGGQQAATVRHPVWDQLKQLPSSRRRRRYEWLDRPAQAFARGGLCAYCIADVLHMNPYDIYQVSFFDLLLIMMLTIVVASYY
jgi:hypothetical protein